MRAEFLEVEVEPDSSFDDLLSNPVEAYQQVFGSVTREAGVADLDWKNHLFCQVSCLKHETVALFLALLPSGHRCCRAVCLGGGERPL